MSEALYVRSFICQKLLVIGPPPRRPETLTAAPPDPPAPMPVAGWLLTRFVLDQVLDEPGLVGAGVGAVGAAIGHMAETQAKDRDGIEYVLEMDDGRLVTLVQNRESDEQPLPDGARVLVQLNGQYTRVMVHPAVDYNAVAGAGLTPTAPVLRQCQAHGQARPIRAGGAFGSRAATWPSSRAGSRHR
jgi:hypothetical protein